MPRVQASPFFGWRGGIRADVLGDELDVEHGGADLRTLRKRRLLAVAGRLDRPPAAEKRGKISPFISLRAI
jgi:hypothetical protein